jgi:mono/diheme cytochrome c family protein
MTAVLRILVALAGLAAAASQAAAPAGPGPEPGAELPPAAKRKVAFARDIQPILEASCLKCHARGKAKGGLSLESRAALLDGGKSGPAVVPGHSAESLLITLVSGLEPESVMPAKGSRLTPAEVGLLRAWIDQGLPWDPKINFARRPPQNLTPQPVRLPPAPAGLTHPVDRLLAPYFQQHKRKPAKPVDDRVYARRVYLDAIGLLPPPGELEAFVRDPAPDKRQRLVDRLLADQRHYAEHWLTFWNDALRNDYRGTGYIDGGRKPISAWLYAALATNLPYDRFVAALVNPTPESEGFVKGIVWRGVVNASQTPEMQAAQGVSQVFLGVNLKCASCHDSFVSDWTLAEAYGMAAVYAPGPLEMFRCDKPTGTTAGARFLYPQLGEIPADAPKAERQKRLAEIITARDNGRLTRTMVNRLWQKFLGRGLVEPADDMEQAAWNPDLLGWLADDLAAHGYDLKRTMKWILTSRAYQLPPVNLDEQPHADYVFAGPAIRRLTAEQFRDAVGQLTGVWFDKANFPAATNEIRASLVVADPLAVALGRPNREQVSTTRASAATTLQALELTNGETLAKVFARGADKILAAAPASHQAVLELVYAQALGRKPSAAEEQIARALLDEPVQPAGVADLLWATTMLPEFQLIY